MGEVECRQETNNNDDDDDDRSYSSSQHSDNDNDMTDSRLSSYSCSHSCSIYYSDDVENGQEVTNDEYSNSLYDNTSSSTLLSCTSSHLMSSATTTGSHMHSLSYDSEDSYYSDDDVTNSSYPHYDSYTSYN